MCCEKYWKRMISFSLAFTFGFLAVNILQKASPANYGVEKSKPFGEITLSEGMGQSSGCKGSGGGGGTAKDESSEGWRSEIKPLRIISRPKPDYTDEARQNQITGVVRVRVEFLPTGRIGLVAPISGLPYGLTENAVTAAKNITFEPSQRNGVPEATTKVIEYSFTIY